MLNLLESAAVWPRHILAEAFPDADVDLVAGCAEALQTVAVATALPVARARLGLPEGTAHPAFLWLVGELPLPHLALVDELLRGDAAAAVLATRRHTRALVATLALPTEMEKTK